MSLYLNLLHAIAEIFGLILLGLLLKNRSIISEAHKPVFGKLVTDFALPALIFTSLYSQTIKMADVKGAAIMFTTSVVCLVLAWTVGKYLSLKGPQLGAFVIAASFGSSSSLGYSVVGQVFPGDTAAIADAVTISELGVGIPAFVLGVAVASYFGHGDGRLDSTLKTLFASPIFISLVLGLAFSIFKPWPGSPVLALLVGILNIIGNSLVVFVALSIALMIRMIPLHRFASLIVAVAAIELLAQPLITFTLAETQLLPVKEIEVLLIESSMPSGTIAAVLADRFGCDGALASALVIATYALCMMTIPLIMLLAI